MKPITPEEVTKEKQRFIPDEVFEVFNELIAKHWNGHSATIYQKAVCAMIAAKMHVSTDYVYTQQWLDIEDIYREAGWSVEYDKPAYCESYEAYFKFRRKR